MLQFIILLLILLLLILYIYRCENENFNVTSEHRLYMKYRDYINGINPVYGIKAYPRNNLFGLRKISDNCFVDKMRNCSKNNDQCVAKSLLQCLGPPII